MESASLARNRAAIAIRRLPAVGFLSLIAFPTLGTAAASSAEFVNALDDGVAMDGFDVVAYFKKGAPVKGEKGTVKAKFLPYFTRSLVVRNYWYSA